LIHTAKVKQKKVKIKEQLKNGIKDIGYNRLVTIIGADSDAQDAKPHIDNKNV
jgi:hypothetical protein